MANLASQADLLPLTVLVPETVDDPIVICDQYAALRFAVAERDQVVKLGTEWDESGNYILLDNRDPATGQWGVYVGKAAPGGVRSRLMSHLKAKAHWSRVVIVRKDTTHGFTSAHVGWLEGRLYDLMDDAKDATLHNSLRPADETLPAFERAVLESAVTPIRRLLRLLGYDPASANPVTTTSTPSTAGTKRSSQPVGKAYFNVSIKELVAAGALQVSTALVSTNTAWPANAVVQVAGVEYKNKLYDNPSSAASAAKNGGSVNGWDFWAVETPTGRVTLATYRSRYMNRTLGPALVQPKPEPTTDPNMQDSLGDR